MKKNEIVVRDAAGQPVTTSLAIAQGTEVQHKNVMDLIASHMVALEQFGLVAFETRARSTGQHGGGDVTFAVLNEQQSALVIAFMRNSDIVVAFKVALVKGFFDMRAALAAPTIATKPRAARIPSPNREAVALFKLALPMAKLCGFTGNQAILAADKFAFNATSISPLSMMGTGHLIADQRGQTFTPTQLGAERGISGQAMNKLLRDSGAQILDASGSWAPTASGMTHAEWLDTAKKHSNGAPVKQLKWFATVTDLITAGESA